MDRRNPVPGFTLVEAAVAIAVAGILAGMMAPLATKVVDRHRTEATRVHLRDAFEAMFGARGRRVPNMRADFGFDPRNTLPNLRCLVAHDWGLAPPFGPHAGASFHWGYNGPYWHGPEAGGNPVDAWGSPIRLLYDAANQTWQLQSLGPDRLASRDDLFYPPVPAPVRSYEARVTVDLARRDGVRENLACAVFLRHGGNAGGNTVDRHPEGGPAGPPVLVAPAGVMELVVTSTTGAFQAFTVPLDLLPGENRVVEVRL